MNREKEYWYIRIQELLKETDERPGSISIRADLCSQIITMPPDSLFEICSDLNSLPQYWIESPKAAMNCTECNRHFGACLEVEDEIDYAQCRQRFLLYADQTAGGK